MAYLLGIDIGTSGTKTLVMEPGGRVAGEAYQAYPILGDRPGWGEQAPGDWWRAACGTVREALRQSGVAASDVAAVGLSGQMHGLVMLDGDRQPLGNAIIWTDSRSGAEVAELRELIGVERLGRLTANPLATGFMAASLFWVKKHEPERFARIRQVLLPKDYVRLQLAGSPGSDYCDASSTLLFDTARGCWSAELLALLGFDAGLFPPVAAACKLAGEVTRAAAQATGLAEGTPVVFGGGDLALAAVGNGIVRPGMACSNIGTGGQFFVAADRPAYDPQLRTHTFCHAMPKRWTIGGAVLGCGLSLRWFRSSLAPAETFDSLSAMAAAVEPGCGGLIFLPYLIGDRTPHMDTLARGVFFGLTLRHDKAALARAVMEGVAFALRESLEIIRGLGVRFDTIVVSGGGARSPLWRQIQADVFGQAVRTVRVREQAAIGAAICAGVGAGIYAGVEGACERVVKSDDQPVEPIPANVRRYDQLFAIYRRLYDDNRESFRALAAISRPPAQGAAQ